MKTLCLTLAPQAALSTIAPVALSTSTSSLSWTGLVFWLTLAPLGMLLLPETHFAAVLLVKHLLLGKPRLGPGRQPLMETTWDHLRHYTMVSLHSAAVAL